MFMQKCEIVQLSNKENLKKVQMGENLQKILTWHYSVKRNHLQAVKAALVNFVQPIH